MATDKIYDTSFWWGDNPQKYVPGGYHPVHLGDILNGRYRVFRKLGAGSQSTVWLARDMSTPERRYVAIKVLKSRNGESEMRVNGLFKSSDHPGKQHVELPLDTFTVQGPNGVHFCKAVEPLGDSLQPILDVAFEARAKLNEPERWLGKAVEGDIWSTRFAKRICWQILMGLDYMHNQQIAHSDLQTGNVCMALQYDLNALSENEIQKAVWEEEAKEEKEKEEEKPEEKGEGKKEEEGEGKAKDGETNATSEEKASEDVTSPDSESDSDTDSDDGGIPEWKRKMEERKRRVEEKWNGFEPGDANAEPHSDEWNRANFLKTRHLTELLWRVDGQPLQPDEIHYIVIGTPLEAKFDVAKAARPDSTDPFRLVLIDLGFACAFDECAARPMSESPDFRPPEALLPAGALPATHKVDIFQLGLLFWEVVMLRRLVETQYYGRDDDAEKTRQRGRLLRDLVQRVGPLPAHLRARWPTADRYVDAEGNALDMQEEDGEVYEPGMFEYGDVWHQADIRKPLDMSEEEMKTFVNMIREMLRFEPELRPSTSDLLKHKWFQDL